MALLLMVFWLIMNGRAAADTLITGAAATVLVLLFCWLYGGWTPKKEINAYRLLPRGICYAALLFREIFLANLKVISLVFTRREEPCIRNYVTTLKSRAARAVLANSITLTPGTVTVQLVDNVLTVHCLTPEMADSLTGSAFEKRLLAMEDIVYGKHV